MDIFYHEGEPHEVGQLLVQKELAATLSKLAEADAAATGDRLAGLESAREMFYRGEVAKTIVQCSERVGGLLSMDDLANYRAGFEDPISINLLSYEISSQSVWTQAAVALQALNILESFDPRFPNGLRAMGHNTSQYIHTLTEALKLAFADRERYYGDPDFASVPIDGLLSKEYAATRASLIQSEKAYPEQQEAGDPWSYCDGGKAKAVTAPAMAIPTSGDGRQPPKDGTTHFAVIDLDGNMVCATVSGGKFDSSVFFPELGCTLSTRSEMFFLDPPASQRIATRQKATHQPGELYDLQRRPTSYDHRMPRGGRSSPSRPPTHSECVGFRHGPPAGSGGATFLITEHGQLLLPTRLSAGAAERGARHIRGSTFRAGIPGPQNSGRPNVWLRRYCDSA